MNLVLCIVSVSVSIDTLRAIKRIPINASMRAHSDENDESESLTENDDSNPQIERELDTVTLNGTKIVNTSMTSRTDKEMKFTDFILEAAKVLKTYENNVLEQAFVVIDDEVWKDVYKGCKSHELADIKKYTSDQLGILKDTPADTLRHHLDYLIDILTRQDFGELRDLVDYVNSLYEGESEKFVEFLLALVHKRISADVDLTEVLKDALRYFIFDRYCNLDNLIRRELVKMIKHFWRQFITQTGNDKGGFNKDKLPLVTPFLYEKRDEQGHKKRRFNLVSADRPLVMRWNDKSESGENESTGNKMRANSGVNSAEAEGVEVQPSEGDLISKNITSDEERESIDFKPSAVQRNSETSTTDKRIAGRYRAARITAAGKFKRYSSESKIPPYLRQSNSTIERLINIGTLAKEINDMIGPEGKVLRQGEYVLNWDSLLGMDFLGFAVGDETTTAEMIKAENDEDNTKKDVIISMKAKYAE